MPGSQASGAARDEGGVASRQLMRRSTELLAAMVERVRDNATFARQPVTTWSGGGLMPKGCAHHGGQHKHPELGTIAVPNEDTCFTALGLPLVPPAERNVDTALRLRQKLGATAWARSAVR
jgi:hypothetical protein